MATGAFAIPAAARVRVIEAIPGQLITHAREESTATLDDRIVADPERDLAKIAVIERHHETGRVGIGLVRGFGLTGAFASTVAHDAHDLVVVGVSDDDMAACAARLQDRRRHSGRARDGAVRGELALPVAGLVSDEPVEDVVARLEALQEMLGEQGVRDTAPFMTLSFLALSVIPSLKITEPRAGRRRRFGLVPLAVESG